MIRGALGSRYGISPLGRGVRRAASGTALLTDLVAYWTLDELSDGSVEVNRLDSSGNGNTLTDRNTTASATGIKTRACDFESANSEYLDCASNGYLQMGDIDFTIALWANRESTGTQYFISKGNSTSSPANWAYFSYVDSAGKLYFFVSDGSTYGSVNKAVFASVAIWYFVVLYHDAANDTVGIVVNAGTPTTATWAGGCADGSTKHQKIASRPDNLGAYNAGFDGMFDEIGIWKRILTSDEITWLYNAGAGRTITEF